MAIPMIMPVHVRVFDIEYEIGTIEIPFVQDDIEINIHEEEIPTHIDVSLLVDHTELRCRMAELLRSVAKIIETHDAQ